MRPKRGSKAKILLTRGEVKHSAPGHPGSFHKRRVTTWVNRADTDRSRFVGFLVGPVRKILTPVSLLRSGENAAVLSKEKSMQRTFLAIIFDTLAVSGMAPAQHGEHGKRGAKMLSQKDITEKIDGKKAIATVVEVTLGPGGSSAPHRHPGPVFGYVLEGEYSWAIDDNPARTLKVGETFYEPTGCLHRVSSNPSKDGKTRILAVILHPAEVKSIVIPEKDKNKD
jgi:quercetin dioxygenase-like cupin family protein